MKSVALALLALTISTLALPACRAGSRDDLVSGEPGAAEADGPEAATGQDESPAESSGSPNGQQTGPSPQPGGSAPGHALVRATPPDAPPEVDLSAPNRAQPLNPFPHVVVDLNRREVRFDAESCLDIGWLEFIVCTPGTKEHESLLVALAKPSHVHAALLMAGFAPGAPGRWNYDNGTVAVIPPTGHAIDIEVEYERNGETVREPITAWTRDHLGKHEFPDRPWVFGGSLLRPLPESMGGGEAYAADFSGSLIGLVTFGDETIGWSEVLSDQAEVQPPEWEVNTDRVPRPGTPVTVILKPARPRE